MNTQVFLKHDARAKVVFELNWHRRPDVPNGHYLYDQMTIQYT